MFEVIVLSIVCGFTFKNLAMLLDFCMDYKNYLWKLRYSIAVAYSDDAERKFLEESKANADLSENPADVMINAYNEIAKKHFMFKRWTCVVCFVVFFSCLGILITVLPVYMCFGCWAVIYPFLTLAIIWFQIALDNG